MRISSQIFYSIAKAVKGFLYIRTPVFIVKGMTEFFPVIRIPEHFTGWRERKGTLLVQFLQPCKKFPFEFIPEDIDRDEKVVL